MKHTYAFIRTLAVVGLVVSGALALLLTARFLDERARRESAAFDHARGEAARAAEQISAAFGAVMAIAQQFADDLSAQPHAGIQERLRAETDARPDIDGLAVTFEPFVYDPELRLYQHYRFKTDRGTFDVIDGATYDYTAPPSETASTAWYRHPLERGPMWNEPFFATGAQKVLIEYGVPFFRQDAESGSLVPAGVVTIDYSLSDLRALMLALELGATGYGYVVSTSGTFLAHPVPDVVARASILDQAAANDEAALAAAAQRALAGEAATIETVDALTGETSWQFLVPMPTTGWVLGIVLNKAELQADAGQSARALVAIALAAGFAVVCTIALVMRAERAERRGLWAVSLGFAAISVVLIAIVWLLMADVDRETRANITGQAALDSYLADFRASAALTGQPLIEIPTGVFVQSVEFPTPTSVLFNGYIWQRYPADFPPEAQGFALPQLLGPEFTIDEVLRTEQGDEEIVVWYVGVELKQTFDTSRFPFDRRDMRLRIAPLALDRQIVLTPDLDAYNLLNPRLLPGLDSEVRVNNWSVQRSLYSYRTEPYNTTFGIEARAQTIALPEMQFTLYWQRNFLGPFIAYLLPGVVAALMLFAFLLGERKFGSKEEITNTLNYAAALFFVIAVAHTALRESIAAVGITYMEYLYLLLYVAIVAVGINTFLVANRPNWWIIRYQDNLIPRLLFWPLFTGMLLLATLGVFVLS